MGLCSHREATLQTSLYLFTNLLHGLGDLKKRLRRTVVHLSREDRAVLAGETGKRGLQMALELVVQSARMLGADRLVQIEGAHIDGCLYHGASGTLYCEALQAAGARVQVPTTTNVGALNLLKPNQSRLTGDARKMAYRLMVAHERMGCLPSWTCAPYQAQARPALGAQVAWGESNAVAFCNSVLGARTHRYGDFLDIACAISGRAPFFGLHVCENRRAKLVINVSAIPLSVQRTDVFPPVLGALIGRQCGARVPAIVGLDVTLDEDALKALCAAAAATGAVGLIHVVGQTPEAPDLDTACGGETPLETLDVDIAMLEGARQSLTRSQSDRLDAVALGSPHFSEAECQRLLDYAAGMPFQVPVYVCLARDTLDGLSHSTVQARLEALGVEFVVDTCVVVTPILPKEEGVLMTNSAKFAHYALGNTGYRPVFGSLMACVTSAQTGGLSQASEGWWSQ